MRPLRRLTPASRRSVICPVPSVPPASPPSVTHPAHTFFFGQTLLHLGLLEYSASLRARLAGSEEETLRSGEPDEVEVRAASIWAVELVRRAMQSADNGAPPPLAILIDFYLWDYAVARRGQLAAWPIHRTRTMYY